MRKEEDGTYSRQESMATSLHSSVLRPSGYAESVAFSVNTVQTNDTSTTEREPEFKDNIRFSKNTIASSGTKFVEQTEQMTDAYMKAHGNKRGGKRPINVTDAEMLNDKANGEQRSIFEQKQRRRAVKAEMDTISGKLRNLKIALGVTTFVALALIVVAFFVLKN